MIEVADTAHLCRLRLPDEANLTPIAPDVIAMTALVMARQARLSDAAG